MPLPPTLCIFVEMKRQGNILVVDDNTNILTSLRLLLGSVFGKVETLPSPKTMLALLRKSETDVVLLDMNFVSGINSGNEGLFWLHEINRNFPKIPVVLFTAYADVELAVRAMKDGAFDFVVKPWDNRKLVETLQMAYRRRCELTGGGGTPSEMYWGETPVMKRLYDTVEKVAATDANVLITGENGTGKDLLAHELHARSMRQAKKFVTVDMGAITGTLFESELFGHVKGAFTDAKSSRKGFMEEADGGTLFLDEIGNLPLTQQAKLLNALQRRRVTPVGSNGSIPVDIRLICATNKEIEQMADSGLFREDLLYRINTIHLKLPPLRERKADIMPLARRFLASFAADYSRPVERFSAEAENALVNCEWRGNIRELRHTIEKAVIVCDGNEIQAGDLQIAASKKMAENTGTTLEDMERRMIADAIKKYGGNLSLTAEKLGITRQTLYNKMKRFNIG